MHGCQLQTCITLHAYLDEKWRSSVKDIMCAADRIIKAALCQQVRLKQLQTA